MTFLKLGSASAGFGGCFWNFFLKAKGSQIILESPESVKPRPLTTESDNRRKDRLCHRKEHEREHRASEMAEQREIRLSKQRETDKPHRAARSADQRQAVLQQRRE